MRCEDCDGSGITRAGNRGRNSALCARCEGTGAMACATYTGRSGLWHGAIKAGKKVVWTCGHNHRNRDQGSKFAGRSACGCAKSALAYAVMTDGELAVRRSEIDAYNRQRWSSMAPMPPMDIEFELSQRDAIRSALGL